MKPVDPRDPHLYSKLLMGAPLAEHVVRDTCYRLTECPCGRDPHPHCETCGRALATEPGRYRGNTHTYHAGDHPADKLAALRRARS